MSDTRSPPLAGSLPPGRRPWLPESGRAPAGEAWRPSDPPAGSTPGGRDTARRGRAVSERSAIQEALQRRPRSASLLRPQRQFGRKLALGAVLLVVGAVGGVVLGLSLRPGAPAQQRAEGPVVAPPNAAAPSVVVPNPGLPKAALSTAGADPARSAPASSPASPATAASEVDALRKSAAAEQARLDSLVQARTAAETQLAQAQAAQREIMARREAALAALPSVTSPMPRPPRAEPRAEPPTGSSAPNLAPPQSGQQRVVLHHRAGSYAATEAAGVMAAQVREAGFNLGDTRAVTATPSQRVVRYFHADDAPAAARLAGRLGRGWALQDFRSYEPLPSPGLLEVWLPDR